MEQFYIYIYRDPSRNNEPIYVGKGKGQRAYAHLKRTDKHQFVHRLQKMKRNGVEPHIEIINAIDEDHAYFMEECVVDVVGRKDLGKGTLLNLSDGGAGGSSGCVPGLETRQKLSRIHKGKITSRETKSRISITLKGVPKPRVTCPHCGKEGGASGLMMWHHFDNCKQAPKKGAEAP